MVNGIVRTLPVQYCLITVLGAGSALGHAPFNMPAYTLVGFAMAIYLIMNATSARQAFRLSLIWGFGYFAVSLSWLVEPFMVDAPRYGWMAPFALIMMASGLALFWGAAAGIAFWMAPRSLHWAMLVIALAAAEMIRARLFTGFPWASPGHVWADLPFAQLAAYIGAGGLGALTFLAATLLALSFTPRGALSMRLRAMIAFMVLTSGAYGLGVYRQNLPRPADTATVLRLVQPNAPQHLKWHRDHAYGFVARQIEFTAAPPTQGMSKPELIIWPETSVPALLEYAGPIIPKIAVAAKGSSVAFGVQRGEAPRYFNSLAVIDSGGDITATYDKHHLVPFGEYVPLGNWLEKLGISAFAARAGHGYSAGPGPRVLNMGRLGKVLPLICYEAVFPRDIRNAPERPDWILQITNDAWFGDFSGPQQHLVQARFRAIEFGLPVIRVANTGISAAIDVRGQIRSSLVLGQAGYLDVQLPAAGPATVYAGVGDLPLGLLLIGAVFTAVLRRKRF
ncbi:Apolipoprotein N-acyltransferase [Aliiroseovarius halocynthiae]|uniref:Apolipoprotein N-acyltransferase n=1 Tax=Aliiroseovarius halocynthiae TaxID=985055 RepID=A0A545SYF0_9RHOB|nr:apolipoprotein N-acyltransferase [Aliiroseovarius halocynthiae]TQV69996.1 apolipoprotein N-acyltransferase [Aliiroseovarius halocynthiae]SMR70663.1 Apolipoprotein N-acyltransferase [Aliiroseovarius halocynthiae]